VPAGRSIEEITHAKENRPRLHPLQHGGILTFVAATGDSEQTSKFNYDDENVWLTQKMMAPLYDVSGAAINQYLRRVFEDNEQEPGATIKKYLIVQTESNRQVSRQVDHYSLQE